MTRSTRTAVVVFMLALCTISALGQNDRPKPTRIAVIKAAGMKYVNEVVRIEGFVTQYVDARSTSTAFFYLKDDWGSVMKVRTSRDAPSVGKRYSIEGPVGYDPLSKDLFISEESRVEIARYVEPVIALDQRQAASPPAKGEAPSETATAASTAAPVQATQSTANVTGTVANNPSLPPEGPNLAIYLLIGGAVILVLAAVVFLLLRSRREETPTADYGIANARFEPPPPPEQVIEGKTIKLHAPPPNTVKLQPGWFEVTAGDDIVKQIRFYKLGGDRGAETTFGRAAGRPYAHIQLKAPTVSSRQAKVSFDNGTAQLTNFASTESNPTKVNGRELGVNEAVVLGESDRVEMGEVSLLFHTSPAMTHTVTA